MRSFNNIFKEYAVKLLLFNCALHFMDLKINTFLQNVDAQNVSPNSYDDMLSLYFNGYTESPTTKPSPTEPHQSCICVPPQSCPSSSDGFGMIQQRTIKSSSSQPQSSFEDLFNSEIVTISQEYNCQNGLIKCCRPGKYVCGERFPPPPRSSKPKYPGQTTFGAYPWLAGILMKSNNFYVGGGALIDSYHILTTAHKVFNITKNLIKVRLGEWYASNSDEPIAAQEYNVTNIYTHFNFQKSNLFNDIAILKLSRPVTLGITSTIGTACLTDKSYRNSSCFISGWGKSSPKSKELIQRHVKLEIKNPNECQNLLRKTVLGQSFNFNSNSFICAGGQRGRDACTGDGGAPLICEIEGRWTVLGLVAWGIGCGTNNVPGVYVNVPSYMEWIDDIVNLN